MDSKVLYHVSTQIAEFPEMTEEWLDLITACRLGKAYQLKYRHKL